MSKEMIYCDNHATTKPDPAVVDAMLYHLTEGFGNASSDAHAMGWEAAAAVETSREQVARLIGARKEEIIFTSGATASNNTTLKGMAESFPDRKRHMITSLTEHKCILESAKYLEGKDIRVSYLPVDRSGMVNPEDLRRAITPETGLVSIMYANNEIGTINPIAELGAICHEYGIPFHVDAAQAIGQIELNVDDDNIDLLSGTAHKFHGPKGAGILYVRKNFQNQIIPIISGGGQEMGIWPGTLNVPAIVGLGKAAELARLNFAENYKKIIEMRQALHDGIFAGLQGVILNGAEIQGINKKSGELHRLPHNLNVSFEGGIGATDIMSRMKKIAVSSGSACTSHSSTPSHVLQAIGVSPELTQASIRFGLSRMNTPEEVEQVVNAVVKAVSRLRR